MAVGTPAPFSATVSGRFVILNWAGVADATDYVIEVGSSSGASDLLVAPVGNVTTVSTMADPRTYFVRVRARTACGTTDPSNEIIVQIS